MGRVDDFSHLERLEGGKEKAAAARGPVIALRRLTEAHEAIFEEQKRLGERRKKAHEEMAILEGRIDLIQLLLRKRREVSQTGNIYLRIHEIL